MTEINTGSYGNVPSNWVAGGPVKTIKAAAVNNEDKQTEIDYNKIQDKLNELRRQLNNPNIAETEKQKLTAQINAIETLTNLPPLDFSYRYYESDKKGKDAEKASRLANFMTTAFFVIGGGKLGAKFGPIGLAAGIATGITVGIGSSVHMTKYSVNKAYTDYTEPQERYLEQLALYRSVIKLIDPKRIPTLPQFEAFNKYTNKLKK